MNDIDGPGKGRLGKFLPGKLPGIFKEGRKAVAGKVVFAFPEAIRKKSLRVLTILPEFQMGAAFKRTDGFFSFFKQLLKSFHFILPEYHFNQAGDHFIRKILLRFDKTAGFAPG
jgi:hypothetical protein